jgi:glycerol-3-phosphate acyltransferase PlsX
LLLVGDETQVRAELAKHDSAGIDVQVIHTTESVDMSDHPAQAVRRKQDNPISVAVKAVKDGQADAMLSAGNSGAVMAASLMILGRIKGIDRPAITGAVPNAAGGHTTVVDLGAVTDPKPLNMVQQTMMADVYARSLLGIRNPRIGLMANGEEDSKGNLLVQTVHPMLKRLEGINFVGNIEGPDVLNGRVDVVVADGFTGNVMLKSIEGTASMLMNVIRDELTASPVRKLAAAVLNPAFRAVARKLDYASVGGAPLLGVDGAVIICHGKSNEEAIKNAVGVGVRAVQQDMRGAILERVDTTRTAATEE